MLTECLAPRRGQLADPLSLVLLIRDDDPLRFERAAVRWLSRYAAEDRELRLAEARELVDIVAAVGRHDQVAQLRLERFLRARGYADEADRVASIVKDGGATLENVPTHLAVEIPPGAETLERDCAECGKRAVWYHAYIGGDLAAGGRGWWQWICAGPLTAEERAAGR